MSEQVDSNIMMLCLKNRIYSL